MKRGWTRWEAGGRVSWPWLFLGLVACSGGEGATGEAGLPDGGPVADASHDGGRCPLGCPLGSFCDETGACMPGCRTDADCPPAELCEVERQVCGQHGCLADRHCPPSAPRCWLPAERCGCGRHEDCPVGQECNATGWCVPEGRECTRHEECPPPASCNPQGWCVATGLDCEEDGHCLPDEHCNDYGHCAPLGIDCRSSIQCGPGLQCTERGFCAAPGRECERAEHCGAGQACTANGYCVNAGRECEADEQCPDGTRCEVRSGVCVVTVEACVAQGCPAGQSCNQYGNCAPTGRECQDNGHCPGREVCRTATGFCVPQDAQCNDATDCGDPGLTCNRFGVCVSTREALLFCEPCLSDADCQSPTGFCLNRLFADEAGVAQQEDICLPLCRRPEDCTRGTSCTPYRRANQSLSLCRPQAVSCSGWTRWQQDCIQDADCGARARCRDIKADLDLFHLQCTWDCQADADCPLEAYCDRPLGYCKLPNE